MSWPFPGSESLLSLALTYWIHSTVLTALAWWVVRSFKPRSNPVREAIWTAALFGAFVTTAMQTSGGVASRLATFELARSAPERASASEPAVRTRRHGESLEQEHVELSFGNASTSPRKERGGSRIEVSERDEMPRALRRASQVLPEPESSESDRATNGISAALSPGFVRVREFLATRILDPARARGGAFVLLGCVFGALWLGWLFIRSRSALAGRMPLIGHPLNEQLDRLRERFGVNRPVALSLSDRIATPVAFGVRRQEICVPERVLTDLDDRQREAMLAHELAHLVRNDPLRLLLARAVESIFFFQPLHRLARRELFEVIERRCDAYAVERLGGGLALAGCLAEVASWLVARRRRALAPAMAESKSALCRRIEQLLDEDATLESEHRQRGIAPFVIAVVPLVALVVPGFAVARGGPADGKHDSADSARRESLTAPAITVPHELAIGESEVEEIDLDEVVEALDAEICALGGEIAELRSLLGDTRDPRFEPALEALEDRLETLEERRISLAALWRARALERDGESSDPVEARDDEAWRNR